MSVRIVFALAALFVSGCVTIHERSWTDAQGVVRTERTVNGVVSGIASSGYYGSGGSVAVIDRGGVNRQPEIRVYDTSPAPVLVRKYDRNGNVIIMKYVCMNGREPDAGRC